MRVDRRKDVGGTGVIARLLIYLVAYALPLVILVLAAKRVLAAPLAARRRQQLGRANARRLLNGINNTEYVCFLCRNTDDLIIPARDAYFDRAGWCHDHCYERELGR